MPSTVPDISAMLMNEIDMVPCFRELIIQKGRETIKQATIVGNNDWKGE